MVLAWMSFKVHLISYLISYLIFDLHQNPTKSLKELNEEILAVRKVNY